MSVCHPSFVHDDVARGRLVTHWSLGVDVNWTWSRGVIVRNSDRVTDSQGGRGYRGLGDR